MCRHTKLSAMSSALSTSGLNLNTTDECLPDSSKHSTTSPSFSMLKIFNLGSFSDLLRRCFVLSTVARFASSLTEPLHLCQNSLVTITTTMSVRTASSLTQPLRLCQNSLVATATTTSLSEQPRHYCNHYVSVRTASSLLQPLRLCQNSLVMSESGYDSAITWNTDAYNITTTDVTHSPYEVNRSLTNNTHNIMEKYTQLNHVKEWRQLHMTCEITQKHTQKRW